MKLGYRDRLYRVSELAEVPPAEVGRCSLPTIWSHSYYRGKVGRVCEQPARRYVARQKGR